MSSSVDPNSLDRPASFGYDSASAPILKIQIEGISMSFRSVFIAIVLGFALIVAAFMIGSRTSWFETDQPNAALVKATGKCAECHLPSSTQLSHEYEMSRHGEKGDHLSRLSPARTESTGQEHNGLLSQPS